MHHVGTFDEAALRTPPSYENHSKGFSRFSVVDHTIADCVHMGIGVCQFDLSQLPPAAQVQMDGYRGGSIHGVSIKMLVDRFFGAQHLTTFIVQFQPGGEGNVHDHPFEESYFFLSGEADALLDGKKYHIKAGDFVWSSVGGTHDFFNTGSTPVRWLETQSPQPPAQQGFRFNVHWQYLTDKLNK